MQRRNHLLLAHVKVSMKYQWIWQVFRPLFLNDDRRISCTWWRRRANSIIFLPIIELSIPSTNFWLIWVMFSPNPSTDHLTAATLQKLCCMQQACTDCVCSSLRTTYSPSTDHLCSSISCGSWFRKLEDLLDSMFLSADGIHSEEVVLDEFGNQKIITQILYC